MREYRSLPPHFDFTAMAMDTAYSEKVSADYSALVVVGHLAEPDGEHEPGFYLVRAWHGRVTFGQLKQVAVDFYRDYSPSVVLVEPKASGISLLQELKNETDLPIKELTVDGDKVSRANGVSPLFESGRVFVPEDVPWLQGGGHWVRELKEELLAFPAGRHDDLVDSLVYALAHLRQARNPARDLLRANQAMDPARIARLRTEAEARAMSLTRTCDVCGKSIQIVRGQPVYRSADAVSYIHRECVGKPEQKGRVETFRSENYPAPRIGGAFLTPIHVKLR